MIWLLLIYTVPSEPARLRATIWRDLKKAGAVYLRDGVAVLPDRAETAASFRAIAEQITQFGGQATLVEGAGLDAAREATITAQATAHREEEYADVLHAAEGLLAHVRQEREHRSLTFAELEKIEADLGKLKRWLAQIRGRDHFGVAVADRADEVLQQCDAALAAILDDAYARTGEEGG
jgi:hypothetical protein